MLTGASLAGTGMREFLIGSMLEPACGEGHIGKVLKDCYPHYPLTLTDLVKREDKFGLGLQGGVDFLTYDFGQTFDNIITNPPFCLAKEFVERALEISDDKVMMFLKIQFLEGEVRKRFFETTPLKTVYVFSKRQNTMRHGWELNENGKPWSGTMCFAWFVWENGYVGKPTVEWI